MATEQEKNETGKGNNLPELMVSSIITALNEESSIAPTIRNCLQAIEDYHLTGEIIVINDGSTDGTRCQVENIQKVDSRVKLINHRTPRGVGDSFWEGLKHAKGNAVFCLPGDNENDPWEILRYYSLLEHVDIVVPFIYNPKIRPWYRNLLSHLYRLIVNLTFMVNFNYTNGTVLYRKSLLDSIEHHSRGFFFQTDILIRCVKKTYLFAEVPYRLGVRKKSVSKALTFPSLLDVIKGYLELINDLFREKLHNIQDVYPEGSQTRRRRGDREMEG